jgi:hypothetical protein
MCTVVLLRRPGHDWPVILGANRDEMATRPWRPPGRHWPDRDDVVAGLDLEAGGSWLGINESGVVAAILNRTGTLGPVPGRRSRGELVLEALDHADAADAVRALTALDPAAYRPFNLIVADNRDAFWIRHTDDSRDHDRPVEARPLPAGVSMITARDIDDVDGSPRIRAYLPLFRRADAPDPDRGDWAAWEALLASRVHDAAEGPGAAMRFDLPNGFATVSSALIALPAPNRRGTVPVFRFAPHLPESGPWQDVLRGAG